MLQLTLSAAAQLRAGCGAKLRALLPAQASPLCVIHGPFGTGKSLLLVAAIRLLLALRDRPGPLRGARVAVAAHTNAAVDRVMLALRASGHTGAGARAWLPAERCSSLTGPMPALCLTTRKQLHCAALVLITCRQGRRACEQSRSESM
jgi:hypothetical protein